MTSSEISGKLETQTSYLYNGRCTIPQILCTAIIVFQNPMKKIGTEDIFDFLERMVIIVVFLYFFEL